MIPWTALSIDVMYVPSAAGYQYILICSDNATSYVWAFPLASQDAKSIVTKIDQEIFQIHGAYTEIAYDGAQQLCGHEMASFLKIWDLRGVQIRVGQKNSNRCEGDISRVRKAMKKVSEDCARTWPRDIKRVLQNLNSAPIPAWKSTITPYKLMFHRTPRTIARPSDPDFQSLTDHIQEMAEGQTRAQDMCRELCLRTPRGQNPGLDLKKPEEISAGDFVLLR